jgi:hypothetical protein
MISSAGQLLNSSRSRMYLNNCEFGFVQHLFFVLFPCMQWVQFHPIVVSSSISLIYTFPHTPQHYPCSSNLASITNKHSRNLRFCLLVSLIHPYSMPGRRSGLYVSSIRRCQHLCRARQHLLMWSRASESTNFCILYAMESWNMGGHLTLRSNFMVASASLHAAQTHAVPTSICRVCVPLGLSYSRDDRRKHHRQGFAPYRGDAILWIPKRSWDDVGYA